jgi:hypothetical protein
LLWDTRPDFGKWHGAWQFDGPILKVEFSRISSSRLGALTLVLDSVNGSDNQVAYGQSSRSNLSQAVEDLRIRERTSLANIGFIHGDGRARSQDAGSSSMIEAWAAARVFDAVVWTDLQSNFIHKTGKPFSIAAAVEHIRSISEDGRRAALDYIAKAPHFIDTPFRRYCATSQASVFG